MARILHVPDALRRGPFSVAEAEACGIRRQRLRRPNFTRLARGVYLWAGLPREPSRELAALCGSPPLGSAFSGLTAARIRGLDLVAGASTEVTVPRDAAVGTRGSEGAPRHPGTARRHQGRRDAGHVRHSDLVRPRAPPAADRGRGRTRLGPAPSAREPVCSYSVAFHAPRFRSRSAIRTVCRRHAWTSTFRPPSSGSSSTVTTTARGWSTTIAGTTPSWSVSGFDFSVSRVQRCTAGRRRWSPRCGKR
jgi:hypothetical protein